MIHLYQARGAGDFEILGPALADEEWATLRHAAARLLRARGQEEAAVYLETIPFTMSSGTNVFSDEFCVLHASYPIEEYAGLASLSDQKDATAAFRAIAEALTELGTHTRHVAILPALQANQLVPSPGATGPTVERALREAQTLLSTHGPASAIDRMHTALHAHLQAACSDAGFSYDNDASITALVKILREQHPRFQRRGPRDQEIGKVLKAISSIIDTLNTLRNRASQAHPTEALLEEADALLVINAARTLLHYLDAKLRRF